MAPLFQFTAGAAGGPFAALAPPPVAGDRAAPTRAQVERALLDDGPALGYQPSLPVAAFTSVDTLLPPLWEFYRQLPAMLLHPRCTLAGSYVLAGCSGAQFEVTASSPAVRAFVEAELARFWERSLFPVQEHGYSWGWAGLQAHYTIRNGLLSCDMLDAFESRDVQPLTVTGNRYVGLRASNVQNGAGYADLWGPGRAPAKGFWYVHRPKKGRLYGYAQPFPAWRPWRRLAARDGAEEVIDAAVYRVGYCGPVGRYPANQNENARRGPPGGQADGRHSTREMMQAMVEGAKSGLSVALSSARDDKGEYLWDLEFPQHTLDTSPLINYANWIEGQIDEGYGVPSELIEAAETGSGYSGRRIPLIGYLQSRQHDATSAVRQWKEQIGDPTVLWNFGRGAWFDVKVKPLVDTWMQSNAAGVGQSAATPPPDGQGGAQAYEQVGPRGGHWQVNPQTGAKRSAAQLATDAPAEPAGPSFGCALFVLPTDLADKVRALAAEIPAEDLHDKGREDEPHVTAKHGFLLDDPGLVADAVAGLGPVPITLGPTGVFRSSDTGKPFDVVYVSVVSPALAAVNRLLRDVPHHDSYPSYTPHVTLAYVKPGRGLYHAGDDDLDGESAALDVLTFSDGQERRTRFRLDGSATPAELAARNPAFEERHPRDNSGQWVEKEGPDVDAARGAHAAAVRQSGGKAAKPRHWRALAEHGHHLGTDDLLHLARRLNWLPRGKAMTRDQVLGRLAELGRKHGHTPEDEREAHGHAAESAEFDRRMADVRAGEELDDARRDADRGERDRRRDDERADKTAAGHGVRETYRRRAELATGGPHDVSGEPRDDHGRWTAGELARRLDARHRGTKNSEVNALLRAAAGLSDDDARKVLKAAGYDPKIKKPREYLIREVIHQRQATKLRSGSIHRPDHPLSQEIKALADEPLADVEAAVKRPANLATAAPHDVSGEPRDTTGRWTYAGLDAGGAAERHHANHLALHAAGLKLRADAGTANVAAYRTAYRNWKASHAELRGERSGAAAARKPAIAVATSELHRARQQHAQAKADGRGVRKAAQRVKRAEAAVDALKNYRAKIVGYRHAETGEWTRFFARHPDGTVTYHDRRPDETKPVAGETKPVAGETKRPKRGTAKPPAETKPAKPERQPGDEPGFDFDHPADTSQGEFAIDYSPPAVWTKKTSARMTAGRKAWGETAGAEGIDPRHLHAAAAELMARDWETHADLRQLLTDARDALAEYGGQGKAITLLKEHHGKDATAIRGLDQVAGELARKYPGAFGDAERHGHASDRLLELLSEGSPGPMPEEDAYEKAMEQLREHARHPRHETSDEPIPFATDEPRDDRGRWTAAHVAAVQAAADAAPQAERFGDDKVFISHVWGAVQGHPAFAGVDRRGFNDFLRHAATAGHLGFSRADMVEAMDPARVRASETGRLEEIDSERHKFSSPAGGTVHFVHTSARRRANAKSVPAPAATPPTSAAAPPSRPASEPAAGGGGNSARIAELRRALARALGGAGGDAKTIRAEIDRLRAGG